MQDASEEFTRWLDVDGLGRAPIVFNIIATDAECGDLATRLGVVELTGLAASGSLIRQSATKQIELTGEIKVNAVQSCVVSLEPVAQEIEEKFTVCYTFNKEDIAVEEADYVVGMEETDIPELIEGGRIDVVHAIVEQIALALDPYPRAKDAEKTENASSLRDTEKEVETREPEVHRPFANLKDLMNKK